jgi:redox-sensitive bicupin YhaK (pirin superfamily)
MKSEHPCVMRLTHSSSLPPVWYKWQDISTMSITSRGIAKVVSATHPESGKGPIRLVGTVDCDGAGTEHVLADVDPFILLDAGVLEKDDMPPFGAHPHRGHSVVTVLLNGSLKSWDSFQPQRQDGSANEERTCRDVITSPASYWVDAGSGIFHDETTKIDDESDPKQHVKLLQLWVGIAEADRSMAPRVQIDTKLPTFDCMGHVSGIDGDEPRVVVGHGRYHVGPRTSIQTPHPITVAHVHQKAGTSYLYPIESQSHGGFAVLLKGRPTFGEGESLGRPEKEYDVVVLKHESDGSDPDFVTIETSKDEDAEYVICTGDRIGESWAKKLVANGALIAATAEEARKLAPKVAAMSKEGLEHSGSFAPFGL